MTNTNRTGCDIPGCCFRNLPVCPDHREEAQPSMSHNAYRVLMQSRHNKPISSRSL